MDPKALIEAFGTIGLFLIVFAESGLLFGFFLPGDPLLFTAGLLVSLGLTFPTSPPVCRGAGPASSVRRWIRRP